MMFSFYFYAYDNDYVPGMMLKNIQGRCAQDIHFCHGIVDCIALEGMEELTDMISARDRWMHLV